MRDEGFERRVLPHLDAGFNLACWLLRDEHEARDVAQEAVMRAWRYFHTLRGEEALPWFLRIVRNTAYTWMERRQRDGRWVSLGEDAMIEDETVGEPGERLSAEVDAEMLRKAVDALPPEFREVIVLRELEGMSYKEIAAATEVSIGTVMSRLSRARKKLEAALLRDAKGMGREGGLVEGSGEVRDGM
ncbi:MAG: sigma-70 family RNA polymerase sigma factor [Phycisphaerae bacterium]